MKRAPFQPSDPTSRYQILTGSLPTEPFRFSLKEIVQNLEEKGQSRPYVERALGLEQGTITKMLKREKDKKHVPAGFRSLFNIIHQFPETIEVAEGGYDPEEAEVFGLYMLLKRVPEEQLPKLRGDMLEKLLQKWRETRIKKRT